jgi:cbb3-type cytochrome oxidase subunit 3
MDINIVRGLVTAIFFGAFILMVYWVFKPSKKKYYESMSQLVFDKDEAGKETESKKEGKSK